MIVNIKFIKLFIVFFTILLVIVFLLHIFACLLFRYLPCVEKIYNSVGEECIYVDSKFNIKRGVIANVDYRYFESWSPLLEVRLKEGRSWPDFLNKPNFSVIDNPGFLISLVTLNRVSIIDKEYIYSYGINSELEIDYDTLNGVVLNDKGNPISNAIVSIHAMDISMDTGTYKTVTTKTGCFSFKSIPSEITMAVYVCYKQEEQIIDRFFFVGPEYNSNFNNLVLSFNENDSSLPGRD